MVRCVKRFCETILKMIGNTALHRFLLGEKASVVLASPKVI